MVCASFASRSGIARHRQRERELRVYKRHSLDVSLVLSIMSGNQHHQRLSVCLMLMPILALSCGHQRGAGDAAAFVAPSCLQRQRLLGRRACLSRGGRQGVSQSR